MMFELLAEEIRIERHLVGGDLHDAEPFEEPAALLAVFLHELVVGRGVVALVARVASKESDCVMSAIIGMLAGNPKDMLKSCTFDNGNEFAFFKQLDQALGIKVYFAKPYNSWERGTNENHNGIVCKILPRAVRSKPSSTRR